MNSKNFQPVTAFELLTEIRKGGEMALYLLKDVEEALYSNKLPYGIKNRESMVRLISLILNGKDPNILDAALNCVKSMKPEEQKGFENKLQELYSRSSGLLRFETWRTLSGMGSAVKSQTNNLGRNSSIRPKQEQGALRFRVATV